MQKDKPAFVATLAVICMMAEPAFALDGSELLKFAFGSDQAKDLGVPIFVAIGIVSALFFWMARSVGKRRRNREIEDYNAKLADYSARLRKGRR